MPRSLAVTPAETYAVSQHVTTYVDTKRTTDAHGGKPELPSRTLRTLVIYPTPGSASSTMQKDAKPLPGPWPVIVFGHGSTRAPEDYESKLAWWASAGYVIVAPAFPLSTKGTAGGTSYGDYLNQTGDESFLLDAIFAETSGPLKLASLVDHNRVGLGGQSFGAITALGTVAAKCCADKRIKAATSFAGVWLSYPGTKDQLAAWAKKVPVLFFHGSDDPTLPYKMDRDFFERLGAPGGFVTLVGSGHDPGFFDASTTPLDKLVSATSLAFYNQHLKDGPDATPIIAKLVDQAGPKVATFTPST